jgi:hypothetical protein
VKQYRHRQRRGAGIGVMHRLDCVVTHAGQYGKVGFIFVVLYCAGSIAQVKVSSLSSAKLFLRNRCYDLPPPRDLEPWHLGPCTGSGYKRRSLTVLPNAPIKLGPQERQEESAGALLAEKNLS